MNLEGRYMKLYLLPLALLLGATPAIGQTCARLSDTQVHTLFDTWNSTLASASPQRMAALYTKDAVLLPTLSRHTRNTPQGITEYFQAFLKKGPSGQIEERSVVTGCNEATDVGTYTFSFADGSQARARYSFVYRYQQEQWLISHHHSSLMPEG